MLLPGIVASSNPLVYYAPWKLFSNSEKGLLIDPSDLSTVFQDTAGTTPSTFGDPVGLVLDKRLWGGKTLEEVLAGQPERITNGGFNSDLSSWVVGANISATWVNGEAEVTFAGSIGAAGNWFYATDALETNDAKRWRVEFDATWVSGGNMDVGAGYTLRRTITPNGGVKTRYAVVIARGVSSSDTNKNRLTFGGTAGAVWRLDNVSVKEIPGNHLSQPTTAARPILARMPKTGRRNMLTWTEEFDNAAWSKIRASIVPNAGIAPDGTLTADKLVEDGTPVNTHLQNRILGNPLAAGTYTETRFFKAAGRRYVQIVLIVDLAGTPKAYAVMFDLQDGVVSSVASSGTPTATASSITDEGDGWHRCSVTIGNPSGLRVDSQTALSTTPTAAYPSPSYSGDGTSGVLEWGAQLELGSIATPYQRVTNAYDVTEEGVPDCYYLRPDLTDDALTTVLPQSINGDILIAGTNGTIIEPFSGDTLTIGPNNYSGGTPGIMAALGDIVAVLLIDRTLSETERRLLVAYYKSKGAKGLLVPGPELNTGVVNTIEGDYWTEDDGIVTAAGLGGSNVSFNLAASTVVGKYYLFNIPASISVGTWYVDLGPGTAASQIGGLGNGTFNRVLVPANATSLIRVGRWAGTTVGTIGPISIKELRPQEDWT